MSRSLKVLTILFILLAIIVLMLGDKKPHSSDDIALSFEEFDSIILSSVNKISPVELADYLIKQEHHYNLIDLQGETSSYHIPTADVYSISEFLAKKTPVNETIILYSKNETEAIQLYYLLVVRGYFKVKVLTGGITAWFDDVLQPNLTDIEGAELNHRKKITDYFGGSYLSKDKRIDIKEITLEKKKKKHHGC